MAALAACSGEERSPEPPQSPQAIPVAQALPTAEEIDRACRDAAEEMIRKAEAEGAIFERTFYSHVVRLPSCRWTGRTAAQCDFEQATIYVHFATDAQIAAELPKLRDRDWKPMTAKLKLLPIAGSNGLWSAPGGCEARTGA